MTLAESITPAGWRRHGKRQSQRDLIHGRRDLREGLARHLLRRNLPEGGIHGHINMIVPHILELKARNSEELSTGRVKPSELIAGAGARLMRSS